MQHLDAIFRAGNSLAMLPRRHRPTLTDIRHPCSRTAGEFTMPARGWKYSTGADHGQATISQDGRQGRRGRRRALSPCQRRRGSRLARGNLCRRRRQGAGSSRRLHARGPPAASGKHRHLHAKDSQVHADAPGNRLPARSMRLQHGRVSQPHALGAGRLRRTGTRPVEGAWDSIGPCDG